MKGKRGVQKAKPNQEKQIYRDKLQGHCTTQVHVLLFAWKIANENP